MIATVTFTKRPLHIKLLRPLMVRILRHEIASAERWIADLIHGGVYTAEQIAKLRAEITPIRARLILWERA